jgi:hypothetical protein
MKSSEPSDDVAAMRRLDQQAWGDAYDKYVVLRGIVCAGDNPVIQLVDSCFRGSPEF